MLKKINKKLTIAIASILILSVVTSAEAGLFSSKKKKKTAEQTAAAQEAEKKQSRAVLDGEGTVIQGESALSTGVLPGGSLITSPEERKARQQEQEAAIAAKKEQEKPLQEIPDLSAPVVMEVNIEGNKEVVADHIRSVISTKTGTHLSEARLRKDSSSVFDLGFFANVDYKVKDVPEGVAVTFVVQENPIVESINFKGNTVFTEDQLRKTIFTSPGSIFNRTFFRNDLQRIKEKYQQAGYAMANVEDVKIDGANVTVVICEPRVSQIIIQGNKITKKKVIQRYLKIKEGELFNSNKLRLTLNRLQGLGFFNDVNVNFEPTEKKDEVVVVITVEEGKTSRIGFNVAYGSQSGLGGGVTYDNFNIRGEGLKLSTGFQAGRRGEIWITLEQPFMDTKVMSWKFGVYRRAWSDLYYYDNESNNWLFQYDRKKTGAFVGFGKRFSEKSKLNWYLTLDYHKVYNETSSSAYPKWKWPYVRVNSKYRADAMTLADDLGDGRYYSATVSLRRFNIDEYAPYTKGDSETLFVQPGKATVDNTASGARDYTYVKYWLEARGYWSLEKLLGNVFDYFGVPGTDTPPLLAIRLMGGTATGDVPYDEMYTIGGDYTLRGYRDDYFHGEQMLLGNFELRVPIQKALSLVGFFDVGRAWRKDSGVSFGSDIGKAPGIGVRLKTPFGNVRLDYASGDEGRFHFGFGEMF